VSPTISLGVTPEIHQIPVLETLKLADAPEPFAVPKASANDQDEKQLIAQEQVTRTLDEAAKADNEEQEVAIGEPIIPVVEDATPSAVAAEIIADIIDPDLQTEVALTNLVPTKNGTLGAEGITLYLGQPDIIPPRREQLKISTDPLKDIPPRMRSKEFEELNKTEIVVEPTPETGVATEDAISPIDNVEIAALDTEIETIEQDLLTLADPTLKSKLPKIRPSSIPQQAKDARNSLLVKADPELADLKPKIRPRNLSIPQKALEPEKIDPSEIEIAVQEAVRNIARPRARPSSLKKIAAKAKASAEVQAEEKRTAALTPAKATGTSKPSATSPVNVQKEATEKAGFSKRRISLIGVYGTASSRRALVRLPSGRFVKVKTGQKVSGWKVSAIGESSVRISKGSRNHVLRMPK
jgi:type IV pilus biogenesis protein PilP